MIEFSLWLIVGLCGCLMLSLGIYGWYAWTQGSRVIPKAAGLRSRKVS